MENIKGFFAVLFSVFFVVTFLAFISDLLYIKTQKNPASWFLFFSCVLILTGSGVYYLWT